METEPSIVIVGAGFSGLGMAIRLRQAGITDFVILEKADRIGGTWRDNHYPGAACDVESHLYSFSFAPNPEWSRTFAPQAEILAYLEQCVERYEGSARICGSGAGLTSARYERDVHVAGRDRPRRGMHPRVLVAGCGPLSTPALPDIPGLDAFIRVRLPLVALEPRGAARGQGGGRDRPGAGAIGSCRRWRSGRRSCTSSSAPRRGSWRSRTGSSPRSAREEVSRASRWRLALERGQLFYGTTR